MPLLPLESNRCADGPNSSSIELPNGLESRVSWLALARQMAFNYCLLVANPPNPLSRWKIGFVNLVMTRPRKVRYQIHRWNVPDLRCDNELEVEAHEVIS